jgi:hypothetical protein
MKLLNTLKSFYHLRHLYSKVETLNKKIEDLEIRQKQLNSNDGNNSKFLVGKHMANLIDTSKINDLDEAEFSVYSQWGDDGIIQYLIKKLKLENKTFVEFGVENYLESNTRFLLMNNNWTGLVIDGDKENIKYIKNDKISWLYDLYALESFITKENINQILSNLEFGQEIGILSIDIDGNDYYIWKEINVVDADIVIVEYNSIFGYNLPYTIPYSENFVRKRKSPDMIYYGSSLLSLCDLATEKGYYFVGCNSNGNNAYFLKNKYKEIIPAKSVEEGFNLAKFREVADVIGNPLTNKHKLISLKDFDFFDTRKKEIVKI